MLHLGWLHSTVESWSFSHSDFIVFLGLPAETLFELTMTYFPTSENELLECLYQVAHLDLRFALHEGANDPITNRLLEACTIPSSTISGGIAWSTPAHAEIPLLPRLEYINLQCHGALYANATLLKLIQSMWKSDQRGQGAPRQLRYFRLLSMKAVSSEVEKHVKAWRDEGLEIDIQCLVVR